MRYLYMLLAALALAVVFCDHYTVGVYLSQLGEAQQANNEELSSIVTAERTLLFSQTIAYVAEEQTKKVVYLDDQLKKALVVIKGLQADLTRATEVIIEDGSTIKELTDQNSILRGNEDQREEDEDY